jgi:hypothetical protein
MEATLKSAVCCCSATRIHRRRGGIFTGDVSRLCFCCDLHNYHEPKVRLRMLILLLFFSGMATALHFAAGPMRCSSILCRGHLEICSFLIASKADVSATTSLLNPTDRTPLHYADHRCWNREVLRFLVFQKADVDARDFLMRAHGKSCLLCK